ncbi:hypothetical protein M5778_003719 [Salmonella enterica]|nr:hypothetical protein [Salmonella enterica]EJE9711591.1 hypothetical protein [Salmonella enterica]
MHLYNSLVPIITAILGFLASFIMSYFTNKWSDSRIKAQNDFELSKEKNKTKIERGEELYVHLSKWRKAICKYQLNLMRVAKKQLTRDQVNEMVSNTKNDYNPDRMMCLLHIHYPSLVPFYDKVDEVRGQAVKIGMSHDRGEITDAKCFKAVDDLFTDFNAEMDVLLQKLREEISKYA